MYENHNYIENSSMFWVQVGNGSNGLESKVLEELDNNTIVYNGTSYLFTQGKIYTYAGISNVVQNGVSYLYIGNTVTTTMNNAFDWGKNSAYAVPIGSLNFIPTHTTIALDNANSPASKWFECLEEGNNGVLAGVYGQEVVYGADTGNFVNLSNGTTTDFSNNTVRTFHGAIPLNGKIK